MEGTCADPIFRTRRVKCDEAKPACARCISAKRKCGYDPVNSPPRKASPEPVIVQQPALSSAPWGLHPATDYERQNFNLLRTLIVNQINGGIKSEFWTKNLLQATYVYPAVWHAALALAAMYQRATCVLNNQDPHFAAEYYAFAVRQFSASVGFIIGMNHSRVSGPEQEMLLTTTALYTGICLLRGDLAQAKTHALYLAKLSLQWRFLEDEDDHNVVDGVIGRANTKQLLRDVCYSFNTLLCFSDEMMEHFTVAVSHDTRPYASLDDAYYAYINIHSSWTKIKDWEPDHFSTTGASPAPGHMQERQHALNLWAIRFEAYLQLGTYTQEDAYLIEQLQLFHLFEDTFDTIMIHRTPEIWAKNAHKWERILKGAERLLEKQNYCETGTVPQKSIFYYSLSVQQVLRMTGFICRNGIIRRRIIKLLQQWQHCDGLWDNELSWRMVEAKMLKEESALAAAAPASCDCVPDLFFCIDHRVAGVTTELLDDGCMLVRMQTGLELKQGLPGDEVRFQLKRR
ncbi:hypothetical protein NLG97_g4008 [Lecanicillium saksenae]|uniref:Uncharacterized protein n=1 Tax=Lecanicillium saksenae TaxID=468837 RepID=A0ACC1QZ66_9HYPO|nr:hypothetical protein NLG97_g4008 [Lecanicillium saksenae]